MSNFTGFDDRKGGAPSRGVPGLSPHVGPNGNWFVGSKDTGVKAGANLSRIINNHLTSVVGGELKDSGVTAKDGSITTSTKGIGIGVERIGTVGETLGIINLARNEVRAPLYQMLQPNVETGSIRAHGALEPFSQGGSTSNVTNPKFTLPSSQTYNSTLFEAALKFAAAYTNVRVKVFVSGSTEPIWQLHIPSVTKGKFALPIANNPIMVKKGANYEIEITSDDGDLDLKGGGRGVPYFEIKFARWTDEQLATQKWVSELLAGSALRPPHSTDAVTHIDFDDQGEMVVTYGDGSKQSLPMPTGTAAINALKGKVATIENTLASQGADIAANKQSVDHIMSDDFLRYLESHGFKRDTVTPVKPSVKPKRYSLVSTSDTWPTDVSQMTQATGAIRTTGSGSTAEYVYLAVQLPEALKVTGIQEDRGIPSVWGYKDITSSDGSKYRIFRSPHATYDSSATWVINEGG